MVLVSGTQKASLKCIDVLEGQKQEAGSMRGGDGFKNRMIQRPKGAFTKKKSKVGGRVPLLLSNHKQAFWCFQSNGRGG